MRLRRAWGLYLIGALASVFMLVGTAGGKVVESQAAGAENVDSLQNSATDSFSVCAKQRIVKIKPGETGSLEIVVQKRPEEKLSYQWYEAGYPENNKIPGATASVYVVSGLTEMKRFICEVSDGSAIQEVEFMAEVDNGLKIDYRTIYFADAGERVELFVDARADSGPLEYSWFAKQGTGEIADRTAPKIIVTAEERVTQYHCTVTDQYGNCTGGSMFVCPTAVKDNSLGLQEQKDKGITTVGDSLTLLKFEPQRTGSYVFYAQVINVETQDMYGDYFDIWLCDENFKMKGADGGKGFKKGDMLKISETLTTGSVYYVAVRGDGGGLSMRVECTSSSEAVPQLKPEITLNAKELPLSVKQSTMAIKVGMSEGDSIVSWKSSNPKVATVNAKGKITGKREGTAVITVTLKSGATAQVKIKVQKSKVKTKKLEVDKKKLTLKRGKSFSIKPKVMPLTSQEKVKYASSNKKVASVSASGKIEAKRGGKAKITVKSGKKQVVIMVTVKNK